MEALTSDRPCLQGRRINELLKVTSKKKTPIKLKESQEDRPRGDRRVGHPEDERHPSVPPLEVPLPFAEDLDVPTAPTELPKQQLLLLPDPPPASKVCI